jgi:uncharacterized RDD family membrane protein YckC
MTAEPRSAAFRTLEDRPAAPAGFWLRYAAWSLDALVLLPLATWTSGPWLRTGLQSARDGLTSLLGGSSQRLADALVAGQSPATIADALLADPALHAAAAAVQAGLGRALGAWLLAYAVLATLWHVAGTRSPWHGSPGKHLLGLVVTDRASQPLGLGRALARHFAAALSWLTLNLGHAMIALPPTHRALHDRLAGTRV